MSTKIIREGLESASVPDVWIEDVNFDTNWNAFAYVYIGFDTTDDGSHRGLFTFDLSTLPSGASIISAKLTFNAEVAGSGADARVHRLTNVWNESQATWGDRTTGVAWATSGGDYSSVSGHYVDWNFPSSTGDFDISGIKVLVEDAIANRSNSLDIILKKLVESAPTEWISLTAGESVTPGIRPRLTVEYSLPMSGNTDLYIKGINPPAIADVLTSASVMDWFLKTSDHDPQVLGTFTSAVNSVTIEVWETTGGQNISVSLVASGCYHTSDTEQWAWSTANLPTYTGYMKQFFYIMTANNNEIYSGQFFIDLPEDSRSIYPSGPNEYLW